MNAVCVPLLGLAADETALVEVTVAGKKQKFNYKIESFAWGEVQVEDGESRASSSQIENLQGQLADYASNWELVQIYQPKVGDERIQVLMRQRN